jgi:hypothetical protein
MRPGDPRIDQLVWQSESIIRAECGAEQLFGVIQQVWLSNLLQSEAIIA